MLPSNNFGRRRASSPVAFKNQLVRSASSDKSVTVAISKISDRQSIQPLYHHQSTVGYLSSLPPSHFDKAVRYCEVKPLQREFVVQPPPHAEHIDLRFDIRIKTPKQERPSIPELFNRFERQNSHGKPTTEKTSALAVPSSKQSDSKVWRLTEESQRTTVRSEQVAAVAYDLKETRVLQSKELLSSIKCSVCSNQVSASQIDKHYDNHTKMFRMQESSPVHPVRTLEDYGRSAVKGDPNQTQPKQQSYSPVRSRTASKPNIQLSKDQSEDEALMVSHEDRQGTRQVMLSQQHEIPDTPVVYTPPPVDLQIRLNRGHERSAYSQKSNMSGRSSQKLQLIRNINRPDPIVRQSEASDVLVFNAPAFLEEVSARSNSQASRPSLPVRFQRDRPTPFSYKYEREVPVRCRTNDSVVSSTSRSKLPLNILAQTNAEQR